MPVKVWDDTLKQWREGTAAELVKANTSGGPLEQLVDYHRWMDQTSSLFHRRSDHLQRLDYALAQYQAQPGTLALWVLRKQFSEWKSSKTDWVHSTRNKHDLITLLDRQLSGGADVDMFNPALSYAAMGGQHPEIAALGSDLVEARLGIVYLFGHLECDNFFNIITHGVLDIGAAGITYGSASLTDADKAAGIDPKKDERITDYDTAGTTLSYAQKPYDKVDDIVRGKIGNESLQGTSIDLHPQVRYATPTWLTYDTPPPPSGPLRRFWEAIKEKFYAAADKIYQLAMAKLDWAKEKCKEIRKNPRWAAREAAIEYVPGLLRKLVNFLLGKLCSAVAPLVTGALNIVKGVANTVDQLMDRISEWQGRKKFELLAGTPTTIVEAIEMAMNLCIGKGLYDTCKGVLQLGMDAASMGGSAVVNLVIAVMEALAATIYRLVEIQRMKTCFADARGMWVIHDSGEALHRQPIAFNTWFKSYAMTTPALAMLALNSGICGDKMRFMQMFQDDTSVIDQATFDAGVNTLDKLKIWSASYLKDSGFHFVSNDKMTKGLIELAQSHTDPSESVAKRVLFNFLK